jgi:hypothetical protein
MLGILGSWVLLIDEKNPDKEMSSQVLELRSWIEVLTRRVEELEASAFQLQDHEEIVLITLPSEDRTNRML